MHVSQAQLNAAASPLDLLYPLPKPAAAIPVNEANNPMP
jgi:hypothetical protein